MKISKLFHWLYASVMLLPLFAIGVTCLYTIFNKNAKDSYYGENINQSELVSSGEHLNIDRDYYLISSLFSWDGSYREYLYVSNLEYVNGDLSTTTLDTIDNMDVNRIWLRAFQNDATLGIQLQHYENGSVTDNINIITNVYTFKFNVSLYTDSALSYTYYYQYNKDSFLDNSFYYATRLLKESNYFNWAHDSFLAQPITYITGLFGMDNDNIVIYLLSYWLDISIIWLTFDLVLYVPLLVHRWLDKGVLE